MPLLGRRGRPGQVPAVVEQAVRHVLVFVVLPIRVFLRVGGDDEGMPNCCTQLQAVVPSAKQIHLSPATSSPARRCRPPASPPAILAREWRPGCAAGASSSAARPYRGRPAQGRGMARNPNRFGEACVDCIHTPQRRPAHDVARAECGPRPLPPTDGARVASARREIPALASLTRCHTKDRASSPLGRAMPPTRGKVLFQQSR